MKNEAVKKKKNEEVSNKKAQYHYSLTSFQPQLGRDPDVRYKHCASPWHTYRHTRPSGFGFLFQLFPVLFWLIWSAAYILESSWFLLFALRSLLICCLPFLTYILLFCFSTDLPPCLDPDDCLENKNKNIATHRSNRDKKTQVRKTYRRTNNVYFYSSKCTLTYIWSSKCQHKCEIAFFLIYKYKQ